MVNNEHYLKTELDQKFASDPEMWSFLQLGSLDGVWYWNIEQPDDEWMSPEFWELLGYDPDKMAHSPRAWQDLIFPEDRDVAVQNFEAHCADPGHPYDQIVRYRHADGSTVWVRCRGLTIRDETGRPIRMLGAHNDITAIKRAEEQATAGWKAAEAANAELRTFAYSVSHDLKAPANTLELLLTELSYELGDRIPEGVQQFMTLSLETVGRMKALVEGVIDYTCVIGMESEFETVSLDNALKHSLNNLRADIELAGAVVTNGPMPTILSIGNQMTVLFQNLIGNAIKFRRPGVPPKIHVSCKDRGGPHLELCCEDNGMGIEEKDMERIFSIFQRLHVRDEIEGFGLGLALCQRISKNHSGEISVTSAVGTGSCFTVRIGRAVA